MERTDEIGFGGLKLIQNTEEFCYGIDSVLVADFAAQYGFQEGCKNPERKIAVDLGAGTGIIPHIITYKTDWEKIIGVELQEASWLKSMRNRALNGLENRLEFIHDDVINVGEWKNLLGGKIGVVVTNPPYTSGGSGLKGENRAKSVARHETTAKLEDFIRCAGQLLEYRGSLFMIHRPSRLVDIFCYGRKHGLEPKRIQFISPKKGQGSNLVLVQMIKGGGKQLTILPEIYVYQDDGTYSPEIVTRYRQRFKDGNG